MADAPLFNSFYQDRSRAGGNDICINLYPEHIDGKDGPEIGLLVSRPGLSLYLSVGTGPIHGFHGGTNGELYIASGTTIYLLASANTAPVSIGSILSNSTPVFMVDNNTQVLIVDGQGAWCYTKATGAFNQVIPNATTSAQYPGAVVFQDGFAVVNSGGTNQLYQTNYGDLSNFATPNGGNLGSTANNAYVQGDSNNVLALASLHHEIWVFKSTVIEVWINQGAAGFAFGQLQGVYMQFGCMAPGSVKRAGDSLFWLAQDKQGKCVCMMSEGYKAKVISSPSLTQQWSTYSNAADAIGYAYQQDGHYFYVLTFPTGNETYVYDVVTGKWHQRGVFVNGSYSREVANCYVQWNGLSLVGDYASANVYAVADSNLTDNGTAIRWLRRFPAFPDSNTLPKTISFDSLQILMETGFALPQQTQNLNFLYASNQTLQQVDMLSSQITVGALTPLSTYSQSVPEASITNVCVTPNGKFAYIGGASGTIYQFSIGTNGILTTLIPASISAPASQERLVTSPDGNFLYASAKTGASTAVVQQFSIASNGQLTALTPSSVTFGTTAGRGINITSDGAYLFSTNGNGQIASFLRNKTTGLLTKLVAISGVVSGTKTPSIAITTKNDNLYCVATAGLGVSQFSINKSNGNITLVSTTPGSFFSPVLVGKTGGFLYAVTTVGSIGLINIYAINKANGNLNFISNATIPSSLQALDIELSSDGTLLYCAVTSGTIYVFNVNQTTGLLTLNNSLTLSDGSGSPNFLAPFTLTGIPVEANPQVMLRWSDDGGYTWTSYFTMPAGPIGNTAWRVIQNRLGSTTIGRGQQRIFEISGVDQVLTKIYGAVIEGGPA